MSKKQFKTQASSSRAAAGAFGSPGFVFGGGATNAAAPPSTISYLAEAPDLTSISDANVVVAFKNLSKRDSITKVKALEEIQSFLNQTEDVETGILEAWTSVYPRTSIELARRVRQLAHGVQGQIAAKSGKGIAKYMPRAVGAWLTGLFDTDKQVSKAAHEALVAVFQTDLKRQALPKVYQTQVVEFLRGIIEDETASTLSDERVVSPEEALTKYERTVASAVGLLSYLLSILPQEERNKQANTYQQIFANKKFWGFASNRDSGVRRTVHRFLKTYLQHEQAHVGDNAQLLSSVYVYEGLESDQSASATDYVDSLLALTNTCPTVWTTSYTGRKPVVSRLRHFFKRGSQGAASGYWGSVVGLVGQIPREILPTARDDVDKLMQSFLAGVTRKEEPATNRITGFRSYIKLTSILLSGLPTSDRDAVLKSQIMPILKQYIEPIASASPFTVLPASARGLFTEICRLEGISPTINDELVAACAQLEEDLKKSLPEQAKDHGKTQELLLERGSRLVTLLDILYANDGTNATVQSVENAMTALARSATTVCIARNGKPYAAAAIVASLVQSRSIARTSLGMWSALDAFLEAELEKLLASPSGEYLVVILGSGMDREGFQKAWDKTIASTFASKETNTDQQIDLLAKLIAIRPYQTLDPGSAANMKKLLTSHISRLLADGHSGDIGRREMTSLIDLLRHIHDTPSLADDLLDVSMQNLSLQTDPATTKNTLNFLQLLSSQAPAIVQMLLDSPHGKELLPRILLFTEADQPEIASLAAKTTSSIQAQVDSNASQGQRSGGIALVIQDSLSQASHHSVSVATLIEQGRAAITSGSPPVGMLPNLVLWDQELQPFLNIHPRAELAVSHALGGVLRLLTGDSGDDQSTKLRRAYDPQGLSVPLRMAIYTTRLLKDEGASALLDSLLMSKLFRLLSLTTQLVSDNLSIFPSNGTWLSTNDEAEAEIVEFVSDAQFLMKAWLKGCSEWWKEGDQTESVFIRSVLKETFDRSSEATAAGYYNALSYCSVVAELIEQQGVPIGLSTELEAELKRLRRSNNVLQLTAFIVAHRSVLAVISGAQRFSNELIADLTGMGGGRKTEQVPQQLVLLNAFLQNVTGIVESIAKQRMVFFVKAMIPLLINDEAEGAIQAEICKALCALLPGMQDLYGDHWAEILTFVGRYWNSVQTLENGRAKGPVPLLYASLKLFAVLRRLTKVEEANEDLVDAWAETEEASFSALIRITTLQGDLTDHSNQPLRMLNDLLVRQLRGVSLKYVKQPGDLYPLLLTQSGAIQQAAFELLHRLIPEQQEAVSFDAALENKTARLPDELLSLILETPSANEWDDERFDSGIPLVLRGYCLSWLLVFDHFDKASHKVRSDYIDHLKEGDHTTGLLDFAFDFLGHAAGKPVDISKSDITTYTVGQLDPPLRDFHVLLSHLYYLCLTNTPNLAKSWWMECKSRQKTISVESWTEKYISSYIIATALASVNEWSTTTQYSASSAADDTKPLTVKINTRSAELTASYPVDESSCTIRVTLPPTFPLHQAKVESVNRIAIDERHWQSWLRITQGIIAFSGNNSSVIDGLVAWRRNLVGALKGQTECAICYSIVAEDGKLPGKKCRTCKNTFHGGCLFKWFRTSGGATCPLCRSPFNYG